MSQADPAARLAKLLPADGARVALVQLEKARRKGEAAVVAVIEVDEAGTVHMDVRFSVDERLEESAG